jgi:bacterioferritin
MPTIIRLDFMSAHPPPVAPRSASLVVDPGSSRPLYNRQQPAVRRAHLFYQEGFMGTRGREIVGMDVDTLVELLNRAYASEWLAYYQYWLGAKLIKGPMKDAVAAELNLHATEELNHAILLAGRIIQLGGTPVLDPKDWFQLSACAYDAPSDPHVGVILEQNIAGEQCAISAYKNMMDTTKDKDMVTYNLALTILQQEVEHEEDLQSLQEDLQLMLQTGGR